MSLLPIVLWPDRRLSTICRPVDADEDVTALIADMLETMYDAPGRGLAAPQVGVLKRLFVMDVDWKDGARNPIVMINPQLLWRAEETAVGEEGCLSIPGVSTEVSRPTRVHVRWLDAERQPCEQEFDGFAARCIQHEYDHLDGRVTFDHLSPQARAAADAQYQPDEDTRL